jgi:pantothenate kinase type III
VHVLSVNPGAAAVLGGAMTSAGLTPLPVPKAGVRRHGDGYALHNLGIDRLAAIEGCLASRAPDPGSFVLVVAAGTATTIDAVRADGAHLGGLILPGVATALASLHRAASLLPDIDPVAEPFHPSRDALGHETRSAMQQATLTMTCGAIERVARLAAAEHGLKFAGVCVTGGWGELIAAGTGGTFVRELVLAGGRVMIGGG